MDTFLAGIRLAAFFGFFGAIFALGFASVCKWLKWAPINITVNINNSPGTVSSVKNPDPER